MEMSTVKPQSKFRFERKYNLKDIDYPKLMRKVAENDLVKHHAPRKINNLYLDTLSRESYFENVEGLSERNKYRIRWYGSRFGKIKPTLEVKIKKEYVNRKETVKLPKFQLLSLEDLEKLHLMTTEALELQKSAIYPSYVNRFPLLLNGYNREYYISKCKTTRLTIDRDLWFYNTRFKRISSPQNKLIVEVKYAKEEEPAINMNNFGLDIDKSSKFVLGVTLTS